MDIRAWTHIFKALANPNRLRILILLSREKQMNVSEIMRELDISFAATSRHLILLENLGALESRGTEGHVLYWLRPAMSRNLRRAIRLFVLPRG